nr:MAG TPA: regulatory protein [Caudoviricetes sp.]
MLVETMVIRKVETSITASLDVAETFEKEHNKVLRDIRELECSDDFRLSNFGQSFYINAQGKKMPMYYMTRDGFTLLAMGYTGEKSMKFKEGYIRQFNAMEKILLGKIRERDKGIAVRQALTNALKESQENERMHGYAYSTYTDMVYRTLFGKTAKQLREEKGISIKDNLRDFLTEEELKSVQSKEMLVSGLIDCGWGYSQIRDFLKGQSQNMLEQAG